MKQIACTITLSRNRGQSQPGIHIPRPVCCTTPVFGGAYSRVQGHTCTREMSVGGVVIDREGEHQG